MPGIFLIQNDDSLVEMNEQPYDSEDLLQELLAKYPRLLSGDQNDDATPRRWLLISREMPVPAEEDGAGRWSLDHLFLDQDAVPTLIEVKRSTDTRIRREVVGQMLDYAANSVVYWPVEELRSHFERECERSNVDPTDKLIQFLGDGVGPDEFWQRAKTNLQAGRIRMAFVADVIPRELRRIVEFLNSQMDPAEVLAVEVKQYVGQGMRTLVPKLIGQTAEAEKKKAVVRESRNWDEPSIFAEIARQKGVQVAEAARKVFQRLKENATKVSFGKGKIYGNAFPSLDDDRGRQLHLHVSTGGSIGVNFADMKYPPFSDIALRRELLDRLNRVPGINISENLLERYAGFEIQKVLDASGFDKLLEVVDWVIAQVIASRAK